MDEYPIGDQAEDYAHAADIGKRIGTRFRTLKRLMSAVDPRDDTERPEGLEAEHVWQVFPWDEAAALADELAELFREGKAAKEAD